MFYWFSSSSFARSLSLSLSKLFPSADGMLQKYMAGLQALAFSLTLDICLSLFNPFFCLCKQCLYLRLPISLPVYVFTYVYAYTYAFRYVYFFTYVCVFTYSYVFAYVYISLHIHYVSFSVIFTHVSVSFYAYILCLFFTIKPITVKREKCACNVYLSFLFPPLLLPFIFNYNVAL